MVSTYDFVNPLEASISHRLGQQFGGRTAVITGAGSGIGRALSLTLASLGVNLALCDINPGSVGETGAGCHRIDPDLTITTTVCDVSDPESVDRFAAQVAEHHQAMELLFNNAGIGSTESFISGEREAWERTFNICWGGVYLCTRAFMPLLLKAEKGHVVNVSSINGLWASLGPSRTHSSYSAAKFAVRGFTEALITEFRLEAPHLRASVVMPGHIGTNLVINSRGVLGRPPDSASTEAATAFRGFAPTTPVEAARQILEAMDAGRWRILVGPDAEILDELVRLHPEEAYEPQFVGRLHSLGALIGLVS